MKNKLANLKKFYLITIVDDFHMVFFTLINLFGILFFYEYFDQNLFLTFLPFIVIHFSYSALVTYFTRFIGRLGVRTSLIVSAILSISSSIPIYHFQFDQHYIYIIVWAFLLIFVKLFTHVPIIYLYGKYSNHKERASQFAFQRINMILIAIITPAVGGLISEAFDISGLFLFAIIIMFLVIVPITALPNIKFDIDFNYKKLLKYKGIQNTLFMNYFRWWSVSGNRIWVIFIYLFFATSFDQIGLLITVTSAVSIFLAHFLGKFLTNHNRKKSAKAFFAITAMTWLSRSLGINLIAVPVLDALGRFTENLKEQASIIVSFDWITDDVPDSLEDEVVILREISINLNLGFAYVVIIGTIYFFGFSAAFLLIGMITLLYSIAKH